MGVLTTVQNDHSHIIFSKGVIITQLDLDSLFTNAAGITMQKNEDEP